MKIVILVICGIVAAVCSYLVISNKNLQKLKKIIRDNWGKMPGISRNDKIDSVCQYWIKRSGHNSIKYFIDNITWND
jgi:hypothetical protein